jgi:DNA mismatch repair protein MutS2
MEVNKEIKKEIDNVIDRFGEIRDNASDNLYTLRKQIQVLKGKIAQSFNKALSHYQNLDYLDDIRESVVENKRVLAVKAMYRRKVKGGIMGSSKTGSIVFIEPEATLNFSRELQNIVFEESEEIKKILSQLTDFLRPLLDLIKHYQSYLIHIDTLFCACTLCPGHQCPTSNFFRSTRIGTQKCLPPPTLPNPSTGKQKNLPSGHSFKS